MKSFFCVLTSILFGCILPAQVVNYPVSLADSLRSELSVVKMTNEELVNAVATLKQRVTSLESITKVLAGQSESIEARVSITEKGIVDNSTSIRDTKDGLSSQIQATDDKVLDQAGNIKRKTTWGIIIALIVLALSALLTFLLNKKGNARIEALQGKAEKLNEEIVNRLSADLSEMQKISSSFGALSSAGIDSQNEQELIKALADRITFMEMTLYRMDPSVRGYKQLTKSIAQMKNNLMANGYEIVDMLGKPYHDGMKVTANFVEDENLEQGQQIITGIIKPQINYHGQMIQAAQISVSQNI